MALRPLKPDYIPAGELARFADSFRTRYAGETVPVPIELIVERDLDIVIDPIPGLREAIMCDAYLCSNFRTMKVDQKRYMDERYENRLRFSYAHEVGHYVLHRDLYKRVTFDTIEEYLEFYELFDERDYRNFEWQANSFAGIMLVPEEKLQVAVDETRKRLVEGIGLKSFRDGEGIFFTMVPELCRRFGVSDKTLERRMRDLKLWPYEQ